MSVRILEGDALTVLRTLPDQSVQMCVTSPPYFGLRDYGVVGQLGLEKTPQLYVDAMVGVFSEVKRVLRDDGTLWLNIGDSFNGYPGNITRGGNLSGKTQHARQFKESGYGLAVKSLKPKDLIGVPWSVAFALRDDGWYLRSDIIWAKPNGMPESVRDRPTRSHEMVFLLSKSERYFYDTDAARTPPAPATETRLAQNVEEQTGPVRGNGGAKTNGTMKAVSRRATVEQFQDEEGTTYTEYVSEPRHGSTLTGSPHGRHFLGDEIPEKERRSDKQRGHVRVHAGFNARWDSMERDEQIASGSNLRSVWWLSPAQYREAHFAVMPPALAEICITAGSKKGDVVLDPFSGAGTTALVADRLGRDAIGIELNPAYAAMSRKRITDDSPLFGDVA